MFDFARALSVSEPTPKHVTRLQLQRVEHALAALGRRGSRERGDGDRERHEQRKNHAGRGNCWRVAVCQHILVDFTKDMALLPSGAGVALTHTPAVKSSPPHRLIVSASIFCLDVFVAV